MSWQLLWPLLPHPLWTSKPTKRKRATSLYCINEFSTLKVERGSKCLKTVFLYFGTENSKAYCPKIRKIILHFGQLLLLRKGTIDLKKNLSRGSNTIAFTWVMFVMERGQGSWQAWRWQKVRLSLHSSQGVHYAGAYPISMAWGDYRYFHSSLDEMLVKTTARLPQNLICWYPFIPLGGVRLCKSIKCLAQEHNTMTPTIASTADVLRSS